MPRLSVTLDDGRDAYLTDLAADDGPYDSKAEAVREIIANHQTSTTGGDSAVNELEAQIEDLEAELAGLERENERLHRERRQILEPREEHTVLVRTVERDQTLQERRAQASIFRKVKWAITGMPSEG